MQIYVYIRNSIIFNCNKKTYICIYTYTSEQKLTTYFTQNNFSHCNLHIDLSVIKIIWMRIQIKYCKLHNYVIKKKINYYFLLWKNYTIANLYENRLKTPTTVLHLLFVKLMITKVLIAIISSISNCAMTFNNNQHEMCEFSF